MYKTLSIQENGFKRAKQKRIISIQERLLDPNTFAYNELFKYVRSDYEFHTDEYDIKTTEPVTLKEVLQYKDAF